MNCQVCVNILEKSQRRVFDMIDNYYNPKLGQEVSTVLTVQHSFEVKKVVPGSISENKPL